MDVNSTEVVYIQNWKSIILRCKVGPQCFEILKWSFRMNFRESSSSRMKFQVFICLPIMNI